LQAFKTLAKLNPHVGRRIVVLCGFMFIFSGRSPWNFAAW